MFPRTVQHCTYQHVDIEKSYTDLSVLIIYTLPGTQSETLPDSWVNWYKSDILDLKLVLQVTLSV